MNVARRILVLQIVLHGLQRRTWVIIREDIRLRELGDDEVGRDEAEESCPEQHCRWVGGGSYLTEHKGGGRS